jgi:tRNA threonylcarbamoyladenosine biosynthesis protein TsaE
MKEIKFIYTLEEIDKIASDFLFATKGYKHFAIYGNMGVGKTTLITSICKNLGSNDLISSPSFAIINEYSSEKEGLIFHFDFYRIKNPAELLDIGFHEYCSTSSYCFIEWPENGESVIPDDFIRITLEEKPDTRRVLAIQI